MKTTACLLLLIASRAFAQDWIELAGSATGGGVSGTGNVEGINTPSLALDSHGYPVVAWRDWSAPGGIFVKRWDGTAWVGFHDEGTGLDSAAAGIAAPFGDWRDHPYAPALVLDRSDRPIVAWYTEPYTWEIFLKKWDGHTWIELDGSGTGRSGSGGISRSPGVSKSPSLALDADGNPVVAWTESLATGSQIYLKKWNGTAWVALGTSATGGGLSSLPGSLAPSVAIDATGSPVVAWNWYSGDAVYVRRWDGAAWVDLGDYSSELGINGDIGCHGSMPRIAIDAGGWPVVAWGGVNPAWEGPGRNQVYLKRWTSSGWEGMGSSDVGAGVSVSETSADGLSLAADGAGGLALAWTVHADTGDSLEIALKRFDGSVWVEVAGSATGGGISNTPANGSANPSLAMSGAGQLAVAWNEGYVPADVFLKTTRAGVPTISQCRADGLAIAAGGRIVGEDGFTAKMTFAHPSGEDFQLQVEVAEAGASFDESGLRTGPAVPTRATAALRIGGLAQDKAYHWRARPVNVALGQTYDWICFGAMPDVATEVDFSLRSNEAPVVASAGQVVAAGDREIPVGAGFATDGQVTFRAMISDGHGDAVRFEVEVKPASRAFEGRATIAGGFAPPGAAEVGMQLERGLSKWQYRAVDEHGMASAWTSFGGNGETDADIAVFEFGSTSAGACSGSGAAALPLAVIAALLGAARVRR